MEPATGESGDGELVTRAARGCRRVRSARAALREHGRAGGVRGVRLRRRRGCRPGRIHPCVPLVGEVRRRATVPALAAPHRRQRRQEPRAGRAPSPAGVAARAAHRRQRRCRARRAPRRGTTPGIGARDRAATGARPRDDRVPLVRGHERARDRRHARDPSGHREVAALAGDDAPAGRARGVGGGA